MEQMSLFADVISKSKTGRHRNEVPSYKKNDSINKIIQTYNTIPHIYRLKSLCVIYNRLFLLTFEKKLLCLNYFIEDDGEMYAEIEGTQLLSIKERVIAHIQLLRRVQNNDPTLEYDEKRIDSEVMSLFG